MYVEDAVQAYNLVYEAGEKLAGQAVNFGSGKEISILDLAKTITNLCGRKDLTPIHVEPRPGEVRRLCADTTVAKSLGFKPKYTLEEGLKQLIDWFKKYKHEEWAKSG